MSKENARKILTQYFQIVFKRSGLLWTSENEAEITAALDFLTAAVIDDVMPQIRVEMMGLIELIKSGDL